MYKELTLYLYIYLMAESIKGYGKIEGDSSFAFSLDGMTSYSQMQRLISLTEAVAKRIKADTTGPTKEQQEETSLLKDKNKATQQSIDLEEEKRKSSDELDKKFRSLTKTTEFFKGNLSSAGHGYTTSLTLLTTGVGTLIGALSGYADQLQLGLQRGISGGIMDFAIAAKTGGISLSQFSKALEESGGSFASLGNGATDGAKQFGGLISSVRSATSSVGNMGLSNEQLANFTAQQTKVAISQGFKGKQAQDVVIKNSRSLGNELDTLANRTGKSVLELAQAAIKLAQDPIVANFVQSARNGGAQVSKAAQQFGASLRGIFGEAGDAIASDALKTALGNLPLVITQTGKNMISASSAVYSELERQAKIVKNGGEITAEDQERLRNTVLREVEARGAELRMLANLEGQAGDGARQLLELAKQANFYNSAAGAQRREEDKQAQAFNSAMNKFKANLQALAIPFLKLINGIPWDTFIQTLNTFVDVLGFLLTPFAKLGTILGGSGAGSLIAVVGGVAGALLVAKAGYDLLTGTIRLLTTTTTSLDIVFKKLLATLATPGGTLGGGLGDTDKRRGPGGPGGPGGPDRPGGPGGKRGRIDTSKIEGNAARRRAEEINKARDHADELQTKAQNHADEVRTKAQKLAELKKANPGMTSAEALNSMNARDAAYKETTRYKIGNKLGSLYDSASNAVGKIGESKTVQKLGSLYGSASNAVGKLGESKIGSALGSGKFTIGSWLGSAALDSGANALKENGYETAGAVTSTASGALAGASTGAMIGSLFGPGGTAIGAIGGALVGGISTAFSEYEKSEPADVITGTAGEAADQNNRYQKEQTAELKEIKKAIYSQNSGVDATATYSARQTALLGDSVRLQRNSQFMQS